MNIPASFKLMGRTITVEYDPKLDDSSGVMGRTLYRKNKIILQPCTEGIDFCEDARNETFLHELIHWIFFMLDEDDTLGSNEKLVDGITGLLYQALKTMEYK